MIEQPVPEVDQNDVRRIVARDFSPEQRDRVLDDLVPLVELSPRVQLAVLKLASGDVERLEACADLALEDYRDVLAPAEYPEWSERVGFDEDRFSAHELQEIVDGDWRQYLQWLGREATRAV